LIALQNAGKPEFSKDLENKTVQAVVKGIQEKKGKDIVCLDLRKIKNAVCDWFIVCHGDSTTQVDAIADSVVEETRKETGEKPWHQEGKENALWVLIDYVDVVVHVFEKEAREFYGLESLWADAPAQHITDQA
jgi:ribosome-associated protein